MKKIYNLNHITGGRTSICAVYCPEGTEINFKNCSCVPVINGDYIWA